MPVLAIDNVTKVYPNGRRSLSGASFEIGHGVFGLLGPNGAGKSTLMAILAGELDFEAGSVRLNKTDVRRDPIGWRRRLGFMPQILDFVPHQTGWEYLAECALLSGFSPRALKPRMTDLLERVNLLHAAGRMASTYSRGMKQRLAAAGAFLTDPDLVLLDEPTSGLDPQERVFFRELLAALGRDRIVVLSTHIVADVERCCDHIGILAGGTTLFSGAPDTLTALAEGKVWECPVPPHELDSLAESRRLVALREEDGRPVARLIADAAPVPGAVKMTARLEDAYMALLGETGAKWAETATESGE